MKTFIRNSVIGAFALVAVPALAANVPLLTGPQTVDIPTVNSVIQSINNSLTSQSMAGWGVFRNYLDNGAVAVAQRGTSAMAGGTTGAPVYVADRWAVSTNVTSGAGYGQVVTSSPSPPPGFVNSMKVYRNSGALTQPVCTIQEIPTNDSMQIQGQGATLSFYAQALAGLAADNGNVITAKIITGTGTDEGLGTLTASPATTPAWTGIATTASQNYTITASWARYSLNAIIPVAATEVGVEICFTPTATGAGVTDGFAVTGLQIEQGNVASTFEFRPYGVELAKAERYFYQLAEPAASTNTAIVGYAASATACYASMPFPVTMRAAPTATVSTVTSGTTWQAVAAGAAANTSAIATYTGNTIYAANLSITTTGMTAGQACALQGKGGGATLQWSADF